MKERRKSHVQVKNLLTNQGVKGNKPHINTIIADNLETNDKSKEYKCLFGCFISKSLEEVKMDSNEEDLISSISLLMDKAFKRNIK